MSNIQWVFTGLIFFIAQISSLQTSINSTFQHCCFLGRNIATNTFKCDSNSLSVPLDIVTSAQYQNECLSISELCCLQYLRYLACKRGTDAAILESNCEVQSKTDEDMTYKYCCASCKLGISLGKRDNMACNLNFQFETLWDGAFQSCCNNVTNITNKVGLFELNLCDLNPGKLCDHICVSVRSSYQCQCKPGFTLMSDSKSCQKESYINRCSEYNPCHHNCHDRGFSVFCSCNDGYELLPDNRTCSENSTKREKCLTGFRYDIGKNQCNDINECQEGSYHCNAVTESCENIVGSYKCLKRVNPSVKPVYKSICISGFKFDQNTNDCNDVNECVEIPSPCHRNEICTNTVGSYQCNCVVGFQKDRYTGQCIDINECQINSHNCDINTQRCDNTIGSFYCVRSTGCGTGYTFNFQTKQCEDDDECLLGTHNCGALGPGWECRNTLGSFRCGKKLCDSNRNCSRGSQLIQTIEKTCPNGFEYDNRGTCVDINECKRSNICGMESCVNTIGSYHCVNNLSCGDGLRFDIFAKQCVDINECVEQSEICDHICLNTWTSFVCACKAGFKLHIDNRSCIDINECELVRGRLCMGECINIPGSYKCSCPGGYTLAKDGQTCQDIDECLAMDRCIQSDEVCVNTRGSYHCHAIVCPPNYIKDPNKQNRCNRASYICDLPTNEDCFKTPSSYNYNFISMSSNRSIPSSGSIDLFSSRTIQSGFSNINFSLELISVRAPLGVSQAKQEDFLLNKVAWNSAVIGVRNTIIGPQEIELQLRIEFISSRVSVGFTISKLFIFVSQYDF